MKSTGSMASISPDSLLKGSGNNKDIPTKAHDDMEMYHTCTNDKKPFVGKSGKPKGPFGVQGREF